MREFGWIAVIAGAVMLEVLTAPGTALSGQGWKLCRSGSPGMVHFTMERGRPGSREINSSDVPLANFHGFSLAMLDHSGPAKFEYAHDAGSLQCEGKFAWGRGSGSFKLIPNAAFVTELNRLGFGTPREDQLFMLMMANINLEFVREIHSAGIGSTLGDLIDLGTHGVTLEFIQGINRAGYRDFRARDYIDLRDHGVKPRFIEDLKLAGYELPANQVIDLRDHGIDSGFVRDLQLYGLRPRASELVPMHDHGVTPEYLRGLHEAGFGTLSADEVIGLRDHGVPADFAVEALSLGFHFTARELIDLRDHGVDAKYLRTVHDSGMQNLSGAQITQLRDHGVN